MMAFRQLFGLLLLFCMTCLGFYILTWPSQNRLIAIQAAFAQVQEDEAELRQRMEMMDKLRSGVGHIPGELLWQGQDDFSIEIAQQQAVVDLANEAGVQVLSFGATQAPERLVRPAKGYEIEVEGGHAEIAKLLAAIEQFQPRLAISYLWIRQIPAMDDVAVAPVNMRLAVWGFVQTPQGEP